MTLEPRHWVMLGLLAFAIIVATMAAYDFGGFFEAAVLQQEGHP